MPVHVCKYEKGHIPPDHLELRNKVMKQNSQEVAGIHQLLLFLPRSKMFYQKVISVSSYQGQRK